MPDRGTSWPVLGVLWLLVVLSALLTRPLLPVDETRYATVAWEMWVRGDFLVPYLNGEPYSHKPPLLFWLIHAGWWLFGVSEWVLRAVSPLLAVGILLTAAQLSRRLWPEDAGAARMAPWVLFGCVFLTAFGSWVQFDLLLMLCALLALSGVVSAARGAARGWLLTGIALGCGILAKGPVILLHVLPAALLAPLWRLSAPAHSWWRWYAGLALSVVLAAAIALGWALPAAAAGGDAYREALLWGQTAERVVQSFAHDHPVWWYLPWLPLLLAPWSLLPWVWSTVWRSRPLQDEGMRFCLVWLCGGFIILSLVSGKQLKYLLPLLPAATLLLGRVLSRLEDATIRQRPWLLSLVLLVVGAACMVLPRVLDNPAWVSMVNPVWGALLVVMAIAIVWMPPVRAVRYPLLLAVLSVYVVTVLQLGLFTAASPAYDMRPIGRFIAQAQAEGREVAVADRYHGQFGFPGRLLQPLEQLDATTLAAWVQQHPQGYLVMAMPRPDTFADAVYTQPYRGRYLAIREGRAVRDAPTLLP
ncbi:MAG: glycosyltransferase family 39 protein [Gammaproteobacteria bacterium]|jgi:4-amino-4-deoxy-L-arabinose transferase-like glycosyltransferase